MALRLKKKPIGAFANLNRFYRPPAEACAVDVKRRCARHDAISAGSYSTFPVLPGVLTNAGPSPRVRQFSRVAGLTPINAAASRLGIKMSINYTPLATAGCDDFGLLMADEPRSTHDANWEK